MNEAYTYTRDEWLALGDDKYTCKSPALGASVYHSNYHLCAIIHAIQEGKSIETRVIHSYTGTALETLKRLLEKR